MPSPALNVAQRGVKGGDLNPVYIGNIDPNSNPIPVNVEFTENVPAPNNTTTDPLGIGGIFTGTGDDVLDYTSIIITIISDVPSAELGVEFQFSNDGANWYTTDAYTYEDVNVLKTYTLQRNQQNFRIRYTNGSSIQSTFLLNTLYNATSGIHSSHRIGDTITNEDDAQLTKSVLSGNSVNGEQINIGATSQGELKTSVVSAVGTLAVSQLTTLRDGKILNREFNEDDQVVGTGTATYQDDNKYDLSVASGEWLVYQSRRFYPYYSGKPQKVELTFDNFQPETNVTKRVGYFSSNAVSPYSSDYDGFYLESSGGTISFVIINNGSVVVNQDITTWVEYSSMGLYSDPAHWENFTVVEFNFLWLGGAYIEIKLMTEFGFNVVHSYIYAGTSTDVFMRSPNQPVRYEIRSTTGSGNFRYICNQVASAGSISESGYARAVHTGQSTIQLSSSALKYPLLAIRKQSGFRDNPVRVTGVAGIITTNDTVLWTLEINPTLSAGLTYNAVSNSAVEFAVGDGVITVTSDGTTVLAQHAERDSLIDPNLLSNNFLTWLGSTIDGTEDEYVLCASPVSNNLQSLASLIYMEG